MFSVYLTKLRYSAATVSSLLFYALVKLRHTKGYPYFSKHLAKCFLVATAYSFRTLSNKISGFGCRGFGICVQKNGIDPLT